MRLFTNTQIRRIKMNHDYAHCWDFEDEICPKDCFRAQLVRDLKCFNPFFPVSWSLFKGTEECKLKEGKDGLTRENKNC